MVTKAELSLIGDAELVEELSLLTTQTARMRARMADIMTELTAPVRITSAARAAVRGAPAGTGSYLPIVGNLYRSRGGAPRSGFRRRRGDARALLPRRDRGRTSPEEVGPACVVTRSW